MKKILLIWLIASFLLTTAVAQPVLIYADSNTSEEAINWDREITREESMIFMFSYIKEIPKSYKFIKLFFKDTEEWTRLYDALQRAVYYDIIENKPISIHPKKSISAYYFYTLFNRISGIEFWINKDNIKKIKNIKTTLRDVKSVKTLFERLDEREATITKYADWQWEQKLNILMDVYSTILEGHYDRESIKKDKMLYSAIEGMVNSVWDKYTTYFPPTDSKDFLESLNLEYEWIWAYVDMEKPWEMKIVSPISGSPAEWAGLLWWDIILSVDWKEVTEKTSLKEAVNWIRWPAWSTVKLSIKRWDKEIEVDVVRAKIELREVTWELLEDGVYYIKIKIYWEEVLNHYISVLEDLKKQEWVKHVVIDVRNNPGGFLDKVAKMLWYMIPEWKQTIVEKFRDKQKIYYSDWDQIVDFKAVKMYILMNSWTASASEIMAWTIKDYYPDTVMFWEKTHWKWSVQSLKPYPDGSSLKYTVARWYTGFSETWIDWVWIKPDVKIELDQEKFKEWEDTQLDEVLKYIKDHK